jgi:hypothetical protein
MLFKYTKHIKKIDIFLMYTAYFDESGTHGSSEALVIAGYVASNPQWQEFDYEWKKALEDAGVTHFHMRDFAHSLR